MITRLLIVIGLLVVCVGILLFEYVRASRSAQKIEESIQRQAQSQRAGGRDHTQAEIDELQDRLETAIGTLKSSNLGQGRRGQNALYALPWYMIVGPPGVGKTTAVKNSGLNFPVGEDGIRGIGGTRNCDWFFSDQAIFLDTAGRYMTEKEDEEEWHAFLDMLKENRSRRPINGVIVGMSVEELLDAAPADIERHANDIRRRIGELVNRLEVRFPVYVVFTKCDLIQGFTDFFGDLTRAEREQIWGCTLTDEQWEDRAVRGLFEEEYDRLYEALLDVRTDQLSRSMKREERRRAFVFPLEFASAKESLAYFVDQLFQENPYQENPEFRGFYFTSGTQEGVPIDRVIHSVSEQFDLSGEVEDGSEPSTQTKSYFLKNLFTETIIPDQYLVEQTSRSVRRRRLVRWGVGVASAALVALFALFAGQALIRSEVSLGQVERVAQTAASVEWDGQSSEQNLEALDRLREEVGRLERYENDPPFLRWGLYRGGVVLDPARDLLYQKLRPFVRAQFQEIERRLARTDTVSGSLRQDRRLAFREHLRAYLLLSEEARRVEEEQERTFLRQYLTKGATEASGRLATPVMQERSGQVEAHMACYVEGMGRGEVAAFEARSALVRDVRRRIYQKPSIETLYTNVRQEGTNSLEPLRIGGILRERGGASLFSAQATVSGFYTKQGWNSYVQDRIEEAAQNPRSGDWVLGDSAGQLSDALQDSDEVARQLRRRYFREYASAWKEFLREVEYQPLGKMRDVARALNQLGDPYNSPLLYLLARVSDETSFSTSMADKAKEELQDEAETRATSKARMRTRSDAFEGDEEASETVHPVTRRFRGLHRLEAEKAVSGGAASELTRSLQALRRVGRQLDELVGAPGTTADVAAEVVDGGGDLGSALNTIRNNLAQIDAEVRRTTFEGPILSAWDRILRSVQHHLNDRWERDVYQLYQRTLEGRYPFSASRQNAPLSGVERIFAPKEGIVSTFERQEIDPFLQDEGRTSKTWEGRGIELSSAAMRFFEAASRLSDELFAGGSLQVRFELTPEIPEGSEEAPSPSQVFIRVHGTSQEYQMGYQPTTTFSWPGERGARLLLTTRAGEMKPKAYEGAWAWFRLLEEAEVEPRAQNTYRVRWRFEREGQYSITTRYDLRTERHRRLVTNPFGFFRIHVPETLN